MSVYEQLEGGGFAAPLELSVPEVLGPAGTMDVDGDGHLDLVASRAPNRLVAWLRGPGLTFTERREWLVAGGSASNAYGDLDGDGDLLGGWWVHNLQFHGPGHGRAVQYGLDATTAGTGGRRPFLGSGGPVRPGQSARLVIGRGRGGAGGVLLMGRGRANTPFSGVRLLVAEARITRSFQLEGVPGAAGEGSLVVPLPVTGTLVGRTFDFQVLLTDPEATGGLSATNGLEVHFGHGLFR